MSTDDSAMVEIIAFFRSRSDDFDPADVDKDLIENRVLDSLGFVEFLLLIQEISGKAMEVGEFDVESVRTLRNIRNLVLAEGNS